MYVTKNIKITYNVDFNTQIYIFSLLVRKKLYVNEYFMNNLLIVLVQYTFLGVEIVRSYCFDTCSNILYN